MHLNRRNFIRKSSLASIGLFVSGNLVFNSLNLYKNKDLEETIAQKLKRAADLRKSISQANQAPSPAMKISSASSNGEASLAEIKAIYQEIIGLDPDEVRAYDGMRKTMLQEKHKELEVFNFFLGGYTINNLDLKFKDRLAKEYLRLAIGNKKFTTELNHPEPLLYVCRQMFLELKNDEPDSNQYEAQYLKADRLVTQEAGTLDARDNPALKEQRRLNRLTYKERYNALTSLQIKERLDNLLARGSNTNLDKNIRDVYKIYIDKLLQENQVTVAVSEISNLIAFDPSDCNSLSIARRTCNKHQYYTELEAIERGNDLKKNSLWSKIALFDVLYRKYKLNQGSSLVEMGTIIGTAEAFHQSATESFELKSRRIKLALAQNNLSQSLTLLTGFADQIYKITSSHWIDRYNMLCVDFYKKSGDTAKAIRVINIALRENDEPLNDSLSVKIALVNKNRETKKAIHNERLIYQRDQLLN